jgi:hypothetical protein
MTSSINLIPFCARKSDCRFYLHQPWSRDAYTYATDGFIAVRTPVALTFPKTKKRRTRSGSSKRHSPRKGRHTRFAPQCCRAGSASHFPPVPRFSMAIFFANCVRFKSW